MTQSRGVRNLGRMKWLGVGLPIALIWAFEVVRHVVLDRNFEDDLVHVAAAIVSTIGIAIFGIVIWRILDRTERQLVAQNRDLTATHAVSSVTRGGIDLDDTLARALERMVAETGALAGVIRARGPGEAPLVVQRPAGLPDGLAWVGPLLDEARAPAAGAPAAGAPAAGAPAAGGPARTERPEVDTAIIDVPLVRAGESQGVMRLVFHPPLVPAVSDAAFADIAGEIATSIHVGRLLADLRRREREQHALYKVALQLTGRADLREIIDQITHDARELVGADRAVACLAASRADRPQVRSIVDRLAITDDGTVCTVRHRAAPGTTHEHNPDCRIQAGGPAVAWLARPLRGPDGPLGELCVARTTGGQFSESEGELLGVLADLAAVAVRTASLHEAEEQWLIASERDRIARELHDSIAQVLGVIHLRLRDIESRAGAAGAGAVLPALADLAEIADEAYRDVREAILGLRETISGEAGLEGALREYVAKFGRQAGISASFTCEGSMRGTIPPRTEVQLLRVVQEALTNVRKHAGATRADVRVVCLDGEATLIVEDNGVGFDPARVVESLDHGFGMSSMRERVEQVGGSVDVHTAPGQGTKVIVRLQAEGRRVAHSTEAEGPAR